ncbi:MAG: glycosyltransferase family 39 protein [Thermoleophilia bacterium]|nr:glycosyltransferase family 39 protein [Thermoleophilia bacterium]
MRARALTLAGLAALVAGSLLHRTGAMGGSLWIDEGISVGIASHPLAEIPGVLRQDGSPPVYYWLLHGWMDLFGRGEAAVRALSLLAALAAVPAGYWAGSTLFGRRAGWIAAALLAVIPFLTLYGQEARMYALVALLGLLAAACLLHAFAYGRRRYLWGLAPLLALLMLTHNWALFLLVGALAAALVAAGRAGLRDALLVLAVVAAAYAWWVPTLLAQAAHTGAPWANRPGLLAGLAAAAVLASAPLLARLGRDRAERRAIAALAVMGGLTILVAFAAAHAERMWATRYLAVVVGPLVLLGAVVLARLGRAGLALGGALLVVWALGRPAAVRSNVEAAAVAAGPLGRGDVVLSTQPEQVPVLAYYLPGPRYATPLGPVADTRAVDWRDALPRLRAARPEVALTPLLDRLPAGGRLLLVRPVVARPASWRAPWTRSVRDRSAEWHAALAADPRFRAQPLARPAAAGSRVDVEMTLYRKHGGRSG